MDNGLIFDIERFSTADGPGIRTVVFFKGCNLHCYWCHNPESIRREPELELDPTECIGCGGCLDVCPSGANFLTESGHDVDRTLCVGCFACAKVCPSGARKVIGKHRSLESCMEEILEDSAFYGRSGGGVTLSGGEVLMQSDFAVELLKQCKAEGIHTAIESNLCFPWAQVEKLTPWLDLCMADIKHMDPVSHKEATGLDNHRVLENLQKLDKLGIPTIIRTPIIPGFNDSESNIRATAEFLKNLQNLQYYELLSYNPMGNDKRKRLGYPVPDIAVPSKARMQELASVVTDIPIWVDGKCNVSCGM